MYNQARPICLVYIGMEREFLRYIDSNRIDDTPRLSSTTTTVDMISPNLDVNDSNSNSNSNYDSEFTNEHFEISNRITRI